MTFSFAIFVKLCCDRIQHKYAFIFMGICWLIVDNKNAHCCAETAHCLLLLQWQNRPGGRLWLIAATSASLGK